MTTLFYLFFVFLYISMIDASKFGTDSQSSTQIARRRQSELDGFVLQKSVIYIWAGFTIFLCFSVIFLTVLWIKDTVQLNNKVTELEKKIQDMEQYGVIKPPVPPLFVSAPETKPGEKKTIVKVVNEVKPPEPKAEPTAPKKKLEKTEKMKQKTKKSIKKSTKNPQRREEQVENKNAKSVETDESKSSVSKEITQSVTVDKTTEDSKTTENTISKTIAEKEPEEPSFPSSIATAEVLEISRRRY
ncbi:hypothetical protein CAEBREN_14649 [Caenorhabditis brenneri]|uniref:Uncharacterized protein n=1 Tax=Caenorhabditis brenneri TaxID=135651 RepID=G0NA49_CAEBE|nr:hypothetical protein CAEBREN_14649 [Caenorhabditis brenneri]